MDFDPAEHTEYRLFPSVDWKTRRKPLFLMVQIKTKRQFVCVHGKRGKSVEE